MPAAAAHDLFRPSARRPGFAQQLSLALRELQRNLLTPEALLKLAEESKAIAGLSLKLHDLATLLRDYLDWLAAHDLQDADCLLESATKALGGSFGFRVLSFGFTCFAAPV